MQINWWLGVNWGPLLLNPLNPGHFYEFRKFIKIYPVGITKWNHFIQEESQNIQVYSPKTTLLSINSTKLRENDKSDKMAAKYHSP
jgi:hypothetical protein